MSTTTPPVVAVPNQDEITIDQTDDYIVIHQHDSTGAGDADIYVHRRNLVLFVAALRALDDGQEA